MSSHYSLDDPHSIIKSLFTRVLLSYQCLSHLFLYVSLTKSAQWDLLQDLTFALCCKIKRYVTEEMFCFEFISDKIFHSLNSFSSDHKSKNTLIRPVD